MPEICGQFSTGCKTTFLHTDLFIQKRRERKPAPDDTGQVKAWKEKPRVPREAEQDTNAMMSLRSELLHLCPPLLYPTEVLRHLVPVMTPLTLTLFECVLADLHFLTDFFNVGIGKADVWFAS